VNHRGWFNCCRTDKTLLKAIADAHGLEEYGTDELAVVNEIRCIWRLATRRSELPKIADARAQYKDIEIFDGLLGEQQVANGAAVTAERSSLILTRLRSAAQLGGNAFMLIIFYP